MKPASHDELVRELEKLMADGWTVTKLAQNIGCTRLSIYNWMGNKKKMTPMTRQTVAAFVDKVHDWNDMAQLYGDTI